MMAASVAPFAIFFAGALLIAATRGWVQKAVMLGVPLIGFLNLLGFEHGSYWQWSVLHYELTLVRIDKLSLLFGYLFHLATFLGALFSLHARDTTQHVAAFIYAGSALGAVFVGDLIGLFVFWELLAVSSVFLVWAAGTERAYKAGMRYLLVQVVGGLLLLSGVLIHSHATGSIAFDAIGTGTLGGDLMLLALAIKACFPLLHNWLTDAYPESTPTGPVFLSAFTTKVAVYALARAYAGTEGLIYIGGAMAMFPIFYAVIENDLRRVLAYSLINQVGFMVVGVGLGTELGINGAAAHAFAHVIYKGLLFMSMGAVLHRVGKINGSELGGLYKSMPWTATFCIIGAASISAFPLFSGFVSKSMIITSAMKEGYVGIWLALLFASAGVFHHAGIKVPFFAFFSHDAGHRVKEAPLNMLLAMGLASLVCIGVGTFPGLLYPLLPYPTDYVPYDLTHVLTQLQLLAFSALAFVWLKLSGLYPPELPGINIDAEWFYRRLLPRGGRWILATFGPLDRAVRRATRRTSERMVDTVFRHHGPQGVLARTWPLGSTVLWIAVLLVVFLLMYYL